MGEIKPASDVRWSRSAQAWVPAIPPKQEQAHMMAAPTRQHVSDAAAESVSSELKGLLGELMRLCARHDVVLLTVAEHDELLRHEHEWHAVHRANDALLDEKHRLRAEVERLTKELRLQDQANDILTQDNERLRKGRDDGQSDVGSVAGNADVHDIRRSVGYQLVRMVADTLDPRLGAPQPDGEPVAPMSQRKPYRWGMV